MHNRLLQAFNIQNGTDYTTLFLTTLDEAEEFLEDELSQRNDIAAIAFDGCMVPRRNALDTLHLVRLAKEAGFTGKMIACSSVPEFRTALLNEGCTHKASSKVQMIEELLELLK